MSTADSTPKSPSQTDGRLPNGSVAGIVIGVAVAVALVTFLITFFVVRQKQMSPSARLHKEPKSHSRRSGGGGVGSRYGLTRHQNQGSQNSEPAPLDALKDLTSYEVHLPQSADDNTLKKRTATVLDQIELHVENFYRKSAVDSVNLTETAIERFDALDTGHLSASLASLVPRAKNILPLIKHTLAHMATSAISTSIQPKWSLLPNDLALIPRAVAISDGRDKSRQVAEHCLSRWRVLTAYLRPDPSQDAAYIDDRNMKIAEMVHTISTAFSPWKNTKYSDEQRTQSLAAILEEAANLGIWLFGQPSELRFRWSVHGEAGPREVVVAPGLAKVTDEQGTLLPEPITLIKMAVQEL